MTTATPKRARGRPSLVAGSATIEWRTRVAEVDADLVRDAAHLVDEGIAEYVRHATVVRAAEDLGLDVEHYLATRERRRR